MRKKKISKYSNDRISAILEAFSAEHPDIRNELASILPAYNELLNMKALSFEQFALLNIAQKRGVDINHPSFSVDSLLPPCPKCGEEKKVHRAGNNSYFCKVCGAKFAANWNSVSSGSKEPPVVWLKVLHCILDFFTVSRTCEYCNISATTYYRIRNKLFYAMMVFMDEIKLYGRIRCDNTFVRVSYKGTTLKTGLYPEGSVFDEISFVPRAPRARGGPRTQKDRKFNDVSIFAAIDEYGHVITRFVGVGSANSTLLMRAVGKDRLLLSVPAEDPCKKFKQSSIVKENVLQPGEASILISDKESAIERFAKLYGIRHECHIFRRGNTQMKMYGDQHDIQAVNNIHSRLKEFLSKSHYVSSKYLPGFLVLFEFIVNTGASQAAIAELFCILSRPGGERPASFFEDLFSIPNYLSQWLQEDSPLKKLSYSQILAFHLYSQRRDQLDSGEPAVYSVEKIAEMCDCSPQTVRRNYNNLKSSGYEPVIEKYFASTASSLPENLCSFSKQGRTSLLTPTVLAMYDECAKYRQLPFRQRGNFDTFTRLMNNKYGTSFSSVKLNYYFKVIAERGLRPPLPPFSKKASGIPLTKGEQAALDIRKEYLSLRMSYRKQGVPAPKRSVLVKSLAAKYNTTPTRIVSQIDLGLDVEKGLQSGRLVLNPKL